ncbi:hypothetical protein KR222_007154, partial [Zaprionus bogoriensis]
LNIEATPITNYYPSNTSLETVCMDASTGYHHDNVFKWVPRHVYNQTIMKRPFYYDVRFRIYTNGLPFECRDPKFAKWRDYLECSMRRHMRMEAEIPEYPLQQ